MIRCKFTCVSVTKRKGFGEFAFVYDATLHPVTPHSGHEPSEENRAFFAATPSGQITVGTVAGDRFVVGQDYYIDFTPATAGGAS